MGKVYLYKFVVEKILVFSREVGFTNIGDEGVRKMRIFNAMRIAVITILVISAVVFISGTTLANGAQQWYLTGLTATSPYADDGTFHECDNIMYDIPPVASSSGTVQIIGTTLADTTAWWYSEDTADGNVSFGGENSWDVEVYYSSPFNAGYINAQVVSVAPDGTIERILAEGSGYIGGEVYNQYLMITCGDYGPTSQTVLDGHRIALSLSCSPEPGEWGKCASILFYSTVNPSNLQTPTSDPGFPLPELPTIGLLAIGLCCIAGYAVFRHRKAGANLTN